VDQTFHLRPLALQLDLSRLGDGLEAAGETKLGIRDHATRVPGKLRPDLVKLTPRRIEPAPGCERDRVDQAIRLGFLGRKLHLNLLGNGLEAAG